MEKLQLAADKASLYVEPVSDKLIAARPWVRGWLYCVAFLVFLMVVVGGATRLTDSGLSITEWKPIHGAIPPLNLEEWQEEFTKYQQIPEYEQINKGMSLEEFKAIFWWEWGHRQLGRFIGVAFALPMLFFWLSGRLSSAMKPRVAGLLFLGGLQGGVGWWMVASGLADRVDVSQYRLAIHLILASLILFALLWVARGYRDPQKAPECVSADRHVWPVAILTVFVFAQIFLGAIFAGTHAGLGYNTWPLLDGSLFPQGIYDNDPAWLAPFEDQLTIQFNHRTMAYIIAILTAVIWFRIKRDNFATGVRKQTTLVASLIGLQILLGIGTLVMTVPLHMALTHQAVAILVLAATTILLRDLRDNAVRY